MESLSRTGARRRKKTGWLLLTMGTFFFLLGATFTWFIFVKPLIRTWQAQAWPAVPCEIISSDVASHRSDDGYTYSVEISYRYHIDERSYTSDRYDFLDMSTSGHSGKQKVVSRYPAGSTATCYVNPDNPHDAVIHRGFSAELLFGLIPSVFALIGIGMCIGGIRMLRPKSPAIAPPSPHKDAATEHPRPGSGRDTTPAASAGPVVLEPGHGRWTQFAFFLFFALIWNGISWTVLVLAWRDRAWIAVLFISLFILVGVAVLGGVVYSLLALMNPKVRITLDRRRIPLGETLAIDWQLIGQAGRLRSLHLTLEGYEEATYRRGTRSVTDRHAFACLDVMHLTDRRALLTATGHAEVTLPIDAMHSFDADHNRIEWKLHAHGDIARWPDVNDTWTVTVEPRRPPS